MNPIFESLTHRLIEFTSIDNYIMGIEQSDVFGLVAGYVQPNTNHTIWVTDRSASEYKMGSSEIMRNPQSQVIEIGTGLGGFLPEFVSQQNITHPKPIAIYPVNYQTLQYLAFDLETQIEQSNHKDVDRKRMLAVTDMVKERASFYLSDAIDFRNSTLESALQEDPTLIGRADYCVDNYGAHIYPEVEPTLIALPITIAQRAIRLSKKKLTKETGKMYQAA